MQKGVYTAICGNTDCEGVLYVHTDENGEFPARKCKHCKVPFDSILPGEESNDYRTNAASEEVAEVEVEEVEEEPKKKKWSLK